MALMNIENLAPGVYTYAEVLDTQYVDYLRLARCDEVILRREYGRFMLVSASASAGISQALLDLMTVLFITKYTRRPLHLFGSFGLLAFGAGFLNGWTQTGKRPVFKIVTGVSTGALMAPFAFLGPAYDGALREFYTTTASHNIFRVLSFIPQLLGGESFADSGPLRLLIEQHVDAEFLRQIADTRPLEGSAQPPLEAVKSLRQVMRADIPTVSQDDDLPTMVEKFSRHDSHRLIVIDSSGKRAGLITHDWKTGKTGGFVTRSTVVIAYRPGNPKNIKDWEDLKREDVAVLYPSPKTSGGAMWAALQLAREVENAVIVSIVCDRGDRYLSTGVFPA